MSEDRLAAAAVAAPGRRWARLSTGHSVTLSKCLLASDADAAPPRRPTSSLGRLDRVELGCCHKEPMHRVEAESEKSTLLSVFLPSRRDGGQADFIHPKEDEHLF